MPSEQPSQTLAVSEAALAVDISVHSLRRWCEWHAEYLSPVANPTPGTARRFTGTDIEVLRHVKALRSEGLQTLAINQQLASLTFAQIDNGSDEPDTAIEPAQDSPGTTLAPMVPQDYLAAIERRFETIDQRQAAIEQAKVNEQRLVRDAVFVFMAGAVTALVIVLIIVVVVDLWVK